MTWHVVVRIGNADTYDAGVESSIPRIDIAFDRSGDAWAVGNDVLSLLEKHAGALPEPVAEDLLYLAIAAYAADLRVPRRLSSDRWTRDFVLHIPVQNVQLWSNVVTHAGDMLHFLTGDRWNIRVRPRNSAQERTEPHGLGVEAVCLFSGGLDSLVGALDLLASGRRVALVAHHGSGVTKSIQERVLEPIQREYGDAAVPFLFYAQPPKRNIKDGEPSMRSRSLVFFALGVAVVSALGNAAPLVVAENGPISLNVPLTSARTGSRSTRTTHPHYVGLFRELLTRLGLSDRLEVPYCFKTKGEMLGDCAAPQLLNEVAKLTMSCSHPEAARFQGHAPNTHCGYCVPCIIRRASMAAVGIPDAEYHTCVKNSPPAHTSEAGRDLRAFEMALERSTGISAVRAIADVLRTGPLPANRIDDFAGVYVRGLDEVRGFLR